MKHVNGKPRIICQQESTYIWMEGQLVAQTGLFYLPGAMNGLGEPYRLTYNTKLVLLDNF